MTSLTFYTNPMSRGQIARWMLEETGVAYDTVILDYGTTMKAPDYLAINPMGKVPAIRHGDTIVTECAAICAYLADAFPAANLAPPTDARGAYYRWLFFAAGPLEAAITNKAMGFVLPEGREQSVGYGTLDDVLQALEQAVSVPQWICGDQFTAADVYVGSQVDWGLAFGTMPATPALTAYAERLRTRPAYQRQKAIDNALIAKMQKPA
ncbi:glutathione S-transferase family protein [Sphingobium sp. SA2]|uniref:glutathione S-transferase family protein n=1 Tax=Sphingobium sp. SA2 TaxID=1524832 RepID=UPI0028C2AFA9|nr:glutathione S-transferase family protein [Sphingobium sp. SA2]MDT7536115.1 glutathione S-transferase family protein [Sphingobium sp. SA2]